MRKSWIISLFTAIAVAVGCTGGPSGATVVPEQLKLVPSDALEVYTGGSCDDCLARLDSAHILRKLDFGSLGSARSTLAFCHTNTLSPVLIVEAVPDTTRAAENLLERAAQMGIRSFTAEPQEGYLGRRQLVFVSSDASLATVKRHLGSRTSILDAPGFTDALLATDSHDEWTMLRNGEAGKVLGKDFLSELFPVRDTRFFIQHYADWTCFVRNISGSTDIRTSQGGSDIYFSNVLARLEPLYSRLPHIMPEATDFAIALPIDPAAFRESYEKYLDATLKLEKYNARISELARQFGKSPLDWEKELDVQEVCLVRWEGCSVALVRPAKTLPVRNAGTNEHPGYIPALYGSAFALADDSFSAQMDGWVVVGSEDDVTAFADALRFEDFNWPSRLLKFMVYTPGTMLYQGKDCIKLETDELQQIIHFGKQAS